jgi:hypothetical protein
VRESLTYYLHPIEVISIVTLSTYNTPSIAANIDKEEEIPKKNITVWYNSDDEQRKDAAEFIALYDHVDER